MTNIVQQAKGRWPSLLPRLGVDSKFLTGRHGPCPMCGGKDRFRFTNRGDEGMFYCNQCGGGDGFRLVESLKGLSFKEVAGQVKEIVGDSPVTKVAPPKSDAEIKKGLRDLWVASEELLPHHKAWSYLKGRGIDERTLNLTRGLRQGRGMLVSVVNGTNERPATMHCTYIDAGKKTGVKNMPGKIPDGAAIQLMETEGLLGIAEGVETALSAAQIHDMPVWACLSAEMMMKWRPPQEVSAVVIFGDNDRSFTGHAASYMLAKKLMSLGVQSVKVEIPDMPPHMVRSWDWNDVLRAQTVEASEHAA